MAQEERWLSFPLQLPREVDRLFDEIIHRPWGFARRVQGWNPSIDLYETSEAFVLEADLPGVKKQDVKVEVEGNDLILQGERSSERSHSVGRFHYQERHSGRFVRRMTLPESVDRDKIHAKFSNGVLRVILPKSREKEKRS